MTGITFVETLLSHPHKVLFLWMALVPLIMSTYLFWRASTLVTKSPISILGALKFIAWFVLLILTALLGTACWLLLCYLTSWWWIFYVIGFPEVVVIFVFACTEYRKSGAIGESASVSSNVSGVIV